MISVPYKSAFGSFIRPNAPEIEPDGEIKPDTLPIKEEKPVDMWGVGLKTAMLPAKEETPEDISVKPEDRVLKGEAPSATDTEFRDSPTVEPPISDEEEPPISEEEIDEIFDDETDFEDDPPSKAQKVKAGLAVAGSLGLLYFIARKTLR